jgi:sec-independent protein translocase protein TatA
MIPEVATEMERRCQVDHRPARTADRHGRSQQSGSDIKETEMLAELIGPDLLIVLLVAVVVLFGGAAIPKLARNLGSAKKEFEKGMRESQAETEEGSARAGAAGVDDVPHNPNANPGSPAQH